MKLLRRETATILAALRLWQRGDGVGDDGDSELAAIASNGGCFEPMTSEEIDKLCEALNFDKQMTQDKLDVALGDMAR